MKIPEPKYETTEAIARWLSRDGDEHVESRAHLLLQALLDGVEPREAMAQADAFVTEEGYGRWSQPLDDRQA